MMLVMIWSSCGEVNTSSSTANTNNIENIQKQVPFTIILPNYLPKDVNPNIAGISGPSKGHWKEDSTVIGFGYRKNGTENFIWIMEENHFIEFGPSSPSSIYLAIKGMKVLEEDTSLPSQNSSVLLDGLYYGWNQNGINIKVTIIGYAKDECRKVIESMIKPSY